MSSHPSAALAARTETASGFDTTPDALVVNRQFQFGTFAQAIANVNPLSAFPSTTRWLHALRLKEWQAFQAGDDEYFLVGAIYATKLLDLLQIAITEKKSGRMLKWQRKLLPRRLQLAQGLDGTRSVGSTRGLSVMFMNDIPRGKLSIQADAARRASLPELVLRLEGNCGLDHAGHLVICHPFSERRALYSHKCMMPATGELRMGSQLHALRAHAFMILDDHKGFYPFPMAYDWLTAAACDRGGRIIGFNLTANQIQNPDRYNENALWVGTTVERLPAVRFERPHGVYGTWYVRDREGRVDVRFSPTVRNEVHAGPRHVLAEYYGPFGWVEGVIARHDGEAMRLDGLFGMGEKKRIRM